MDFARVVDQVISEHLGELKKPGVLSVRPGYQAVKGWLTRRPAIVVTVDRKRHNLPPQHRLPEALGGFPVDVREAGPLYRLRATNPAHYTSVAAAVPPELERPFFPYERDLAGQDFTALAASVTARRRPHKPQLAYEPPVGAPLAAIEDQVTLICHASPDAGWPMLKPFIEGTKASLTIGMYDFTSAHILETLVTALGGDKRLNLVLDYPAPNRSRDQTDEETCRALEHALGDRLNFAWALQRQNPRGAAWIYPNAYHLKVAVRDGASLWLSSGNLNNPNQPDIDPVTHPSGAGPVVTRSARDWHVIVEHRGLARLYEQYLLNDLQVASTHQATTPDIVPARTAFEELAEDEFSVAPRPPQQYFAPRQIAGRMGLQPILTPDNYAEIILPLIGNARRSFYMQAQYIHPTNREEDKKLALLIEAVAKKIREGLDVRLILGRHETLDYLELLQQAGIDLDCVRIQPRMHNKGMIIDSEIVVVSSHNWSGDGVTRNRDAGLVIYNKEAARYWEQIFLHDWTHLATRQAAD